MMSSHDPEQVDEKFWKGLIVAFVISYGTIAALAWVML